MMNNKNKLLLIIAVLTLALAFTTCRSPADPPPVYTVTFNADNGTENTTQKVSEGGTISAPNPGPGDKGEGYGVTGWYRDDETFKNRWDFASDTVTADITLHARWDLQINIDDFGPGAEVEQVFEVTSTAQWTEAIAKIIGNGSNRNYVIKITGDFGIGASTADTFGALTGLKVSIRGNHTISLSSKGSVLRIGSGQTVIARDADFTGRKDNNSSLVYVNCGELTLRGSAKITGNTYIGLSVDGAFTAKGGGVSVDSGTFTMRDTAAVSGNTCTSSGEYCGSSSGGISIRNGTFAMWDKATVSGNTATSSGKYPHSTGGGVSTIGSTFVMLRDEASISGNKAISTGDYAYSNGGGVTVGGTFIMRDKATISGNTVDYYDSDYFDNSSGGGVYVGGRFQFEGGTIYGNTADANHRNIVNRNGTPENGNGAALYDYRATIQYGTFNDDDTFIPTDPQEPPLSTTDNTIEVENGVLLQS